MDKKNPELKVFTTFWKSGIYAKNLHYLKKLGARAREYIFDGYAPYAYRLWCLERQMIILSRDVIFTNKYEDMGESKDSEYVESSIFENNDDLPAVDGEAETFPGEGGVYAKDSENES